MASLTDQQPIFGGADDDFLTGDGIADVIHGDAGDDTLLGLAGADTLIGGLGNDLLFGGSGANVLYGGAGDDFLTFDSDDAATDLQRLFGGDGTDTLVLEFTQDDYLAAGVIDEVEAYANALAAGQDPGAGAEFVFSTFSLRAANFENVLIFVDGDPLAPGEVPGVNAVDDTFAVTESGAVSGSVVQNDNFPNGAVVSLLAGPAGGVLSLQADGTFAFSTSGAFEALSAGDTTTVTFSYRLTDNGDTSDADVTISITGENDAPFAGAAVADTDENQSINGNLITDAAAGDIDQNDTLTILSVEGQPLNGAISQINLQSGATITVTPSGVYTYAPGAAFDALADGDIDTDVVSFIISDGRGGQVASTLTLTINGENDAPVANPDVATTDEDTFVTIDVLGNDTDVDLGDTRTLVSIDSVTPGGDATISPTGQIVFQPGEAFQSLSVGTNAIVEIEYTIEDVLGARSSSTATVTVTGVNDAPTATDIADDTDEDTGLSGNLIDQSTALDIDQADILSVSAIDGVAFAAGFSDTTNSGAMLTVLSNGDYTYVPNTAFNGLGVGETASDSFTFTITDGRGGIVTQTFEIEIEGRNDGPVVQDISINVDENGAASVDLLADSNAFDPDDNGFVTLTQVNGAPVSQQTPVFAGSNGGQLLSGQMGGFAFDPAGDFENLSVGDTATTTFTFTVEDDQGVSVTRTLAVNVQGENDDPFADPVDIITDEDTTASGNFLIDSAASDIDQTDTLTITDILSDSLSDGALNGVQRTFVLPTGAMLTVSPNGDYDYQPSPLNQSLAEGEADSDSFAFRISDGQGGEVVVNVDVSIDGVNDDPTANAINRGALEDDTVSGDLLADSGADDVDNGDVLRITQIDGQSVNISGDIFAGADGGTIFASSGGGYTFNPNGDFEFLSVGDTATSSFSFRIADSFGGFVDQDITFTVAGANDNPRVDPLSRATDEDTAISGNFLDDGSASDVDQNDILTISRISNDGLSDGALNGATRVFTLASGAQLTVSPDGSYTYDPLQAFQSLPQGGSNSDFLSFVVSDGNGGEAQESLTISIAGVNDAPTLDPITATTTENANVFGNLVNDSNASDVDQSDTVSIFTLEGQDFSAGTVTITRPGEGRLIAEGPNYQYQPLTDFDRLSVGQTADVSYQFTVSDDFGATATTTITFTITGENDGPTAEDFADTTTEDDVLNGNLLTDGNAQDVDQNDVLTITSFNATGPGDVALNGSFARVNLESGARLTVNPNGDYTLEPNGAFESLSPGDVFTEAFSFTVSDGNGGETTQTATIEITGVNDAPVAVDDTATTDQNSGIVITNLLVNDSDVDNNFTLTSVGQPANGGRVLTGNGVFFDPDGDFDFLALGQQTTTAFDYTITDDFGGTDTASVVVTVTGLNDGPVTSPLTATTNEDEANFTFDLLTSQFDVDDGDVLSVENFAESNSVFGAFSVSNSIFSFDARQFDSLATGESQIIVYTYDVFDNFGARASNQLTLTVEGRDEGLLAVDDNFTTNEDAILSEDASTNDTFGAGVYVLDQDVNRGVLTLNPDGTFTFDTNGEFDSLADGDLDSESFSYEIVDGVNSSMATVTIDILGVNDGPEAADISLTTDEDTGFSANLINESGALDPDGTGPIEVATFEGVDVPQNGSDVFVTLGSGVVVQVNRDGDIVYDPTGLFDELSEGDSGFDAFTFTIVDDFGDGISVNAEVEIFGVNDPVEGDDASIFADEDLGASGDLLDQSNVFDIDQNDEILIFDVDGQDVTGGVTITLASGALLTIDEFGSYQYDTNGQFEGLAEGETDSDSFSYSITDGFSSIDLVADITIDGVNDDVVIDEVDSDLSDTFTATGGSGGGASVVSALTLDGTNGFALTGETNGILTGFAVAGGGDFDGDGFGDVVVGSPSYSGFYTTDGGSAFVLFGNGASPEPSARDIPNITPDFDGINFIGGAAEMLGTDAAFVGDVNGDGFDDFLIGNGSAQLAGQIGAARLVFGQAPTNFGYQYLDATTSTTFFDSTTVNDGTRNLGYSVASAGDVNDDGVNDFLIGAPFTEYTLGDQNFGKAFVIYGRTISEGPFGATFDLATLDGTNGFRIDDGATYRGTQLGRDVSGVGDVNGDGIDDIFVAAPGTVQTVDIGQGETTTFSTGAGYVIFGSDGGFDASFDVLNIDSTNGLVFTEPYGDSRVGLGVSGVGDFNGDGVDDFVVGADYGQYAGAAFIVYGSTTPVTGPIDISRLTPSEGFQIIGASDYSFVGRAFDAAGDVNGDGFDDVIIGSPRNFEGLLIGEAYILFGTDQEFSSPLDLANFDADDGIKLTGFDTGDRFGARVSGAGDLNEDGFDDVIVGAPTATDQQDGAAFVFFGSAGGAGGMSGPVGGVGSVTFDDVDLSDVHTTDVNELNNDDDDVTVTFDLITDSTGGFTGEAEWTAVIDKDAFDRLAEGQSFDESFELIVDDGQGGEDVATLTLSFIGVNDAPTSEDAARTTDEDVILTDGDLFVEGNIMDVDDGDTLRIASVIINVDGGDQTFSLGAFPTVIDIGGAAVFIDETGQYSVDPRTSFDFLDVGDTRDITFDFVVEDQAGATSRSTAVVTITGNNDAPTAVDDAVTTEQNDAILITVLDNDIDAENALTLASIDASGAVGSVAIESAAAGTVVFNPNGAFDALDDGEQATDTFSYVLQDSGGLQSSADVVVTILGRNDAPVAMQLGVSVSEDDTVFANFIDDGGSFDVDASDVLVVESVDGVVLPQGGQVVTLASGSTIFFSPGGDFTYNPRPGSFQSLQQGETGQDVISIVLSDGDLTASADLVVDILGVNDAPTASPLSRTTNEDEPAFMIDLLANAVEIDQGDVLSVENFTEVLSQFGSFTLTGTALTYDATIFDGLNAGQSQRINFSYDIVDSVGARVSTTLELNVEGRDEGLLAVDDTFSADEDTSISGDVSLNDTSQGAVFSLVGAPNGDIIFNTDGTFDYDPSSFFNTLAESAQGTDTFTYQIDNGTDTVTANVTITVDGINDAPAIFLPGVTNVRLVTEDVTDTAGGDNQSVQPALSGDGDTVSFDSNAGNLIAGDTNVRTDVYFEDPAEDIFRASVQNGTNNQITSDASSTSDVNKDGTIIVFESRADDLVPFDAGGSPIPDNNSIDIFVRDLTTGETQHLIERGVDGERLNGNQREASISADGRYVVFKSTATNLVATGDNNGGNVDIFRHDRLTDETILVSQLPSFPGIRSSFNATISADGGTIAFLTENSHDPADTNTGVDLYVYDHESQKIELISKNSSGEIADQRAIGNVGGDPASIPSLSANGRYVSWVTRATNLVDDDTNNADDIFVHDRFFGTTERVSVSTAGLESNNASFDAKLSDNGRFVTFQSQATNLDEVTPDTNTENDVFVHDRLTKDTIRVTVTPELDRQPGGGAPDISADGTKIAFASQSRFENFDDRVVTGSVNDIYIATIDTTGYNFSQNTPFIAAVVDLQTEFFDPDGGLLEFSNIDVTSDDTDRFFSVFEAFDDNGRVIGFSLDPSEFADLGVNDYELLTATYDLTDGIATVSGVTGVVIVGENDAPTADAQTFQVNQGASVTGSFFAMDLDDDELTYSFFASALQGDLTLDADGSFTYTSAANQTGDDIISIDVADENGGFTTFDATFEVNLAPTFAGANSVLVARTQDSDPTATNSIDVSTFFADPEGTGLTFAAELTSGASLPGGLMIDAVSGVITGIPGSVNDLHRMAVTATDGNGLSTTGEFWLATVDEILLGDNDDNNLVEGDFSSFIDGLGGNDSLFGDDQTDIFQYTRGDGFDIIEEDGFQERDHLVLNGFSSTDVIFERFVPDPFGENGRDLLIRHVGDPSDFTQGVVVRNGLTADIRSRLISDFNFDDGVTLTETEVRAIVLAQDTTEGDDDIRGFNGADTLEGDAGADFLSGGDGSDLYIFNPEDGKDVIRDNGSNDTDVLQIGYNISNATFSISADRLDLIISFLGDSITLVNAIGAGPDDGIEIYRFLDGDLNEADIRNILLAQTATSGDDLINGFEAGSETLEGGAGNDTMVGRDGIDTYIYRGGDGIDRIEERGFQDNDILQIFDFTIDYDFTTGQVLAGSQVSFSRGGAENALFNNNLFINLDNGSGVTGQIAVIDTLNGSTRESIGTVEFVDSGVSLSMADIRSDIVRQQATSGDDIITGFNAADTLIGGLGDDTLIGEDGTDIYVFSTGDGNDFISDRGFQDSERVVFTDRALADFTITYAPGDDNSIILMAGSDSVEIEGAVAGGNISNIAFYDFTDQTVDEAGMRQILVDQALVLGLDLIGAAGAQIMPSSVGSDRFVSGRDGSDIYTFVSGEGNDTIFDDGNGDTDVLDLTAFTSDFFTSVGAGQLLLDLAFDNNVVLRAGSDRLNLIDLDDFELVQFSDVNFDNDDDDLDGATNFADFVAANGVQSKVLVQGTNNNDTFLPPTDPFAPPVNEHFDLDGGNDDQLFFNVSQIGDDSIFKQALTSGGYDITIDFTGIIADTIFEQSVNFSISRLDQNDLIIDIVHEDSSLIEATQGIGRTEESITINNGLAQFSGVDSISIIRENGTELIATTQELRQIVLDQQATSGDNLILGYAAADTVRGGAGDDTINAGGLADRYEFFAGDERLLVADGIATTPIDVVAIHGYSIDEASLSRSPYDILDLIIDFGADEITIKNFFRNPAEIERIHFDAETATPDIYTIAELTTEYFNDIRTTGGDFLLGSDVGDDTLDGGAGDDTLDGGRGSELYIVRIGEGNDFIRDTGGGTDTIQFNVASTAVTFTQDRLDPNNFHVIMADGTDVEIQNFLGNNDGVIEQFQFTDVTLDAEQARIRAFADLATAGDDTIIGGDAPDTLRGGLGDDFLDGGRDVDVFEYAIGDGDDTLQSASQDTSFELIRLSGVSLSDVQISRILGSRDLDGSGNTEDYLITFANDAGSITVLNGLGVSSAFLKIEIVDEGVFLTDDDIITRSLEADIAAGRTVLQGPGLGGARFPSGASVIYSYTGPDIYTYNAGDGPLTIIDDSPTSGVNRLEIFGHNSTDAVFSRLAAGAEDYLVTLPNGDQILVVGQFTTETVNGVNEIFFDGDNATFDDAAITVLLDGQANVGGLVGGSSTGGVGIGGSSVGGVGIGGSPRISTQDDTTPDENVSEGVVSGIGAAISEDDQLIMTGASDVMRLGAGDDHVRLRGGDDAAWGQAGDDTLIGNGGADTLRGGADEDELRGGGGRDRLFGGADDDVLKGNGGRDVLKGGRGDDDLNGGRGGDVLKGGKGADRIEGGKGDDRLMGQGGEDTFVFESDFGADVVTDFNPVTEALDFSGHNVVGAFDDLFVAQVGANTVISDGVGGQITLIGVDADRIDEGDFIF